MLETKPEAKHLSMPGLEAGLENIRQSPKDEGVLDLIVRRPAVNEREILSAGQLDVREGLVGDTWNAQAARSNGSDPPVVPTTYRGRKGAVAWSTGSCRGRARCAWIASARRRTKPTNPAPW